jgi:lipopolysaccharide transport system ATP-binding protein
MSVVRFEHVSKRFTLRHERPRSFQEIFLKLTQMKRSPSKEEYWALTDVSFEIPPGEMVGIIGPNGAGKSTILKLISRIIEPTSGDIEIRGRIGALLELGAGFHADLTGRENIYLNGSILGFGRAEMDLIYDEIVEFSELEHFIDIPVRHYSSGMYMRLGFSIAIHVQPETLLVDEVLAVGDQAFQLRCLQRINEMKQQGVTIILVSHSLDRVRQMCDRAIWLDGGQIQAEGAADQVIEKYVDKVTADSEDAQQEAESSWRRGSHEAEVVRVQFLDGQGQERETFETGETFIARMYYTAHQRIERPVFGVALHEEGGFHVIGPNTGLADYRIQAIEGDGYVDFIIPQLPLLQGTYRFSLAVHDQEGKHSYDYHHQAYTFCVEQPAEIQERFGSIYIPSEWRLSSLPERDANEPPGRTAPR